MTDSDDLLASIADASQAAQRGTPPPAGDGAARAANLLGQVAKQVAKETAAARPTPPAVDNIETLLGLQEDAWRTFLDRAPTDALVACLVDASPNFRARVVAALDDESRTWLGQNLKLLTDMTPALRETARTQVLGLANRMIGEGVIPLPGRRAPRPEEPAAPVAAPAPGPRVEIGFGGLPPAAAPAPTPAAALASTDSGDIAPLRGDAGVGLGVETTFRRQSYDREDPITALVADLVAMARGKSPDDLSTIAGQLDQPLLVEGLRLIAQGIDANHLANALHAAQADQLAIYSRQLDVMREGLLAIRFGESSADFRRRVVGNH
jgi:hypothetical protein